MNTNTRTHSRRSLVQSIAWLVIVAALSGGAAVNAASERQPNIILIFVDDLGIDDNTLVIFTSDNGSTGQNGGSNVPLRGRKGRTDEGGMRIPCLMRYPGRIPANSLCSEVCGTIDLLPTLAALSGAEVPKDRIIDGKNIWNLMTGAADAVSPHEAYYYQMDQLQCVRSGKWKLHLPMESKKRNWGDPEGQTQIKLYDLTKDIELNASETASSIWQALPIQATVNRWGDEIYFAIPVHVKLSQDAHADVAVGDVAYWPPGQAFCIFWGPTPASTGSEPRAASPVNVFGRVMDRPEDFANVQDGDIISIEQA